MFTGIITDIGTVTDASCGSIDIACGFKDLRLGESIACSGVCLTVAEKTGNGFRADLSQETLARTAPHWKRGTKLNLERALQVGDRFGGHMVSGHVDAVAIISRRQENSFTLRAPAALMRFIAPKGSVTLDGVSLTVNEVQGEEFSVCIVPHTLQATTLAGWKPDMEVNLEVDMLARYVDSIIKFG